MNGIDQRLLDAALQVARTKYGAHLKEGFVPSEAAGGPPPGGDPMAGGAPPPPPPGGDPMAGGDMPPPDAGGMPPPPPPPDAGGMPPPDAGGMPPMPPDPSMADPASIAGQVAQGVQQGMAASGLKSQGPVGPGGKPQVKPDINTIATDVFQLKKMLFAIMRHANIELPPDVLDGPNRDPQTGAPAESPTGGSDVPAGASMQQSSIPPIEPIQGAFPMGGGPGGELGGGLGGGIGGGMGGGRSGGASAGGGFGKLGQAPLPPEFNHTIGRESAGQVFQSKAAATAVILRRGRESGLGTPVHLEKNAFVQLPEEKKTAAHALATRLRQRQQPQEAA